jgi:hypothetical protein
MTDVACFCGCVYSFGGDAAACPRCGEIAIIRSPSPTPPRRPEPASSTPAGDTSVPDVLFEDRALTLSRR